MASIASFEGVDVYERFHFLVNAPALFHAVASAVELDIFRFLGERDQATFEELRAFTGVPAHQLRVLLQAVCSTGLVRKRDGAYVNSEAATDLLAADTPDSWTHIILGWRDIYYPAFPRLTASLRTGTNLALDDFPGDEPTLYQRLSRDPELESVFHRAMSAFTLRSARALVRREEFSPVRRLLDVGGGDGTTSALLADRHPEMALTIFDLPSVSKLAASSANAGRLRFRPGDLFRDDFPEGSDAVLFSHVLEIFSADRILVLLRKAHAALPRGGRVFIYGFNVSENETSGVFSARLGLYFNVLASGQGMAYPARDYEEWLGAVGFEDVRTVSGMPYEHGLTMGVKG
ncbi:methyltransferase [Actinomadura meridiana]|uniref:Methyltransferase n=1 Tax=Actinomadura meridiana TaxID=559626 RepID=A0ABP8BSW7_9ACTN